MTGHIKCAIITVQLQRCLLTAWYLLSVKASANEITASDKIPGEPDASSKSTFSYCYSGVYRQQPTWRTVLSKCQRPTHYLQRPTR